MEGQRCTLWYICDFAPDISRFNFSPVMQVSRNRLECVVTLLSHEAEVDIVDKDGNTALHIAIENKFVPIVQCLVVFGCDINKKNKDGNYC